MREAKLTAALCLALDILGELEPNDPRAVSPEYISMAAVLCNIENKQALDIIYAELKRRGNPNAKEIGSALGLA